MASDDLKVANNTERGRWEAEVEGHTAFAEYFLRGNVVTFPHTVVPPELEGRGIASTLAKTALDDARTHGLFVVPRCPFFRRYIERHPEYQELVEPSAPE